MEQHSFSIIIWGDTMTKSGAKEWKDKADEDLIKELQRHVKHETAPYKYPRIIEFVDELPKTISGKIRRVEIRENDRKVKKE